MQFSNEDREHISEEIASFNRKLSHIEKRLEELLQEIDDLYEWVIEIDDRRDYKP